MEFFSAMQISSYETFFKLVIAALLSLAIGLERELKRKPVGLKTSIVISTFSCLLTIISIESAYIAQGSEYANVNITMDPLRLAAQIVSGIGFLGAGVILKRGNDSISGLTTAAMIWGAGGIGIAVAAGFYIEAVTAVLLVLIGIEVLPHLLFKFGPKRLKMVEANLKVVVTDRTSIREVLNELKINGSVIESISIAYSDEVGSSFFHELRIRMSVPHDKDTIDLYQEISDMKNVVHVEIELI
ncbi:MULTISPECIES: MgtC/SapB family protein [Planococcus]|uniref:Protein sapB n=2 Tax=Planococcus TaxID=1372 RepID=A0ABM5WXY0_9BACL|nr:MULTISPECIES: MgtC/SapB family protein [Planococcus]ALS79182.1 protein sapB [Planococcus kocurii]AQU78851.1 protein sapB [Planococcus faecalis]KAA0956594.1 MgtC/SapB family protein [Planococcus sp. ANT_H30]MDJ0332038.1 MgtC/SapB family protein [Planococcus sp. S3-L1]OHX52930.1 protein sapB [Planococcus faecalis]